MILARAFDKKGEKRMRAVFYKAHGIRQRDAKQRA